MVNLDLDPEEREDLVEFLQNCLGSLKEEVHHTDRHAFRDMLKRKEQVLQRVLDKLKEGAVR
jgi:hypothetical protein